MYSDSSNPCCRRLAAAADWEHFSNMYLRTWGAATNWSIFCQSLLVGTNFYQCMASKRLQGGQERRWGYFTAGVPKWASRWLSKLAGDSVHWTSSIYEIYSSCVDNLMASKRLQGGQDEDGDISPLESPSEPADDSASQQVTQSTRLYL